VHIRFGVCDVDWAFEAAEVHIRPDLGRVSLWRAHHATSVLSQLGMERWVWLRAVHHALCWAGTPDL